MSLNVTSPKFGRMATLEEVSRMEEKLGKPVGYYEPSLCYISENRRQAVTDRFAYGLYSAAFLADPSLRSFDPHTPLRGFMLKEDEFKRMVREESLN